ncbi:MAG TPA: CD3324 family protein [Lachnospiraceae bacterium]|jgi:Mor family transcriptional regulator|nr:CD3324 family protein [Lachnospiraceae bacterium]
MNYINANKILPDHLIQELQKYVQGDYVYIPVKEGKRREWGELSGCKATTRKRNKEIILKYQSGVTVDELSVTYFLSTHAIRKIIYKK